MREPDKWIPMGSFEVLARDDGKVIASIQMGLPSAPLQPMDVIVNGKSIGKYISLATAKKAVERAIGVHGKDDDSLVEKLVGRFKQMRAEESES